VPPSMTTRQQLTERQGATVDALVAAGARLLDDVGYDELTVRAVAAAAGVTHTTAYAYFSSKAHLVAELFWRRLTALDDVAPDATAPVADRITAAMRGPSLLLADEPALAKAALSSLLADDADVALLRTAVGALLAQRIATALGPDADPAVAETVLLVFSGAMVQAGMGYFDYDGVVRRVARTAALIDQ
jgi:TetR/AcrR family transcriptional regulator, cholesterol catabolism regulator